MGLEPTPVTSFYLIHLFKDPPLQIESPSEVLGVKTLTYESYGDTRQPITL